MTLIQNTSDCSVKAAVNKRKKRTLYITKLSRGARGKRAKGRAKGGNARQFRGKTYLPIKFTFTETYSTPVSNFLDSWVEAITAPEVVKEGAPDVAPA